MAQEYVSTSKTALTKMAAKLELVPDQDQNRKINAKDKEEDNPVGNFDHGKNIEKKCIEDHPVSNFDLSEPDLSELTIPNYMHFFPNATKVVVVQKIEHFQM